ncbi:unnamed protein product, partial [Rotaria sordida]
MSYGSFIVNNCCINARRNQREPRVTRECFTVHLWIGEGGKQQTKLSNTRT